MSAETDRPLLLKMYRDLVLTKAYNGRLVELKAQGKIHGPIHQTTGQEAVGIGACAALRPDDYVISTHRGYPEWIARGIDLKKLSAEIFGKAAGLCRGKGGEMLLADPSVGILCSTAIIGGGLPIGVGVALAAKRRNKGQVAMVFFGEGAANTGAFHEALNLAAVLKLPAIFICLNNQWAISTPIWIAMAVKHVADRAAAYGMPGDHVDGNDVLAMYEHARKAVEAARAGTGPSLIEGETYRIGGHSSTDRLQGEYMPAANVAYWKERDPLPRLRSHLLAREVASEAELAVIEAAVEKEAAEAVAFGLEAPFPEPAEAARGVFV